ncbi:hypothetical protein B7P43_G06515 [Cryptotermes secundus]|uniref:C2H2-type domain-containing protein n=1 Tax=Cryptotermes secundus TaxID=105785 RepID=A0A2J7Q4I9_9NEOP|nr:histone H4 transcription factor isoform X2 [Cryptotermes secundus]PNF23497.1 hypothetical protein B7P43_G06515 [Cryptotermes secundus]
MLNNQVCRMSSMASISSFDDLFGIGPFPIDDYDTVANGLENYADYVDSQSSNMEDNNLVCSALEERNQSPVYEEWCDFTVMSNYSDSTLSPACIEKKCKDKKIKLKEEQLDLQCGWRDCDHRTSNLDHFVRHVSFHLPHLEVKLNKDQEGVYVCLWQHCGFESADSREITRHVNFHSYHMKLKCIGSNILARSGLPICTLQVAGKKVVPDLPHAFECCWQTCEETFSSPQLYFNHVDVHVYCNPRGRKVEGGIPCQWRGCMSKSTYRTVFKLLDHIRIHTKEKLVGCPQCGRLFASRARFSYHCKYQVPVELRGPSGELVKSQMNKLRHKCPFCGQSFSCPSGLCAHIRYRHLDSKPFRCSFCEYKAKTHWDMKRHLSKHCPDPLFHCVDDQCNFSCRSAYGLQRHRNKYHLGCDQPQYCCHICDSLFRRGSQLTNHLYIQHSICRPPGQCRFRYKQDEDGFFRLLTVDTTPKKLTDKASQPLSIKEDDLKQEAGGCKIMVSVIEYDDRGSVVSTEDVETTELHSLPQGSFKIVDALCFIE